MAERADSGTTLVVGADSLVGQAYCEFLEQAHKSVIGTTRRAGQLGSPTGFPRVYLDLADDLSNWPVPRRIQTAVLCAGITKFAVCRANPEGTSQVNVAGIKSLAKNLLNCGIRIIYLSTAVVFDGLVPNRKADDQTCPLTEYGRQNAKAEFELQSLAGPVTILRLTKTLGQSIPMFDGWARALIAGQDIHPYSDLTMAPIPLSHAVEVLDRAVVDPLDGILQASGNKDVTYAEAASCCATVLEADPDLVRPITVSQETKFTEPVPCYTTLDTRRLESVYGLKAPDVWNTIREYFEHLHKSAKSGSSEPFAIKR